MALNELGLVRKSQGRIQEAINLFRKAIEIDPNYDLANKNLGMAFQEIGNADAAAEHFDNYEQINPTIEVSMLNALVLPVVLDSSKVIDKWRRRLIDRLTRVVESGETLRDPLRQIGQDHFHLAYHARNVKEIQKHIANAYLKVAPSLGFEAPHRAKDSSRDRIKVGFVSSKLHNHTVGHLNLGYIQHLDRSKFEVHLISPESGQDPIRKKIESAADKVHIVPKSLEKVRSVIAREDYDLLYYPDIRMGVFSYFLSFARLAPVQAVSWGHPVTDGIPAVDYFVSCDFTEPRDAEPAYSEKLVRLPDAGGFYFKPETPSVKFDRPRHNVPNDRPLIVCPQSCFKFHPDFDPVLKA